MDIYYQDEIDKKYKLLATGFKDKEKANEWAKTYSNVFDCKCKVMKEEKK